MTLTLDRVEVTLVHTYVVEVYPHTKLDGNRKKKLCGRTDVRTDGRTRLQINAGARELEAPQIQL